MKRIIVLIFLSAFCFVPSVFAQISTESAQPLTTQTNDSLLERRLTQLEKENDQNNRIDDLINLLGLLGTAILGTFALFGGAIIWNGILWRQEAKKDLQEIETTRNVSLQLLTEIQERNEQSKKVIEEFKQSLASSIAREIPKGGLKKDIETTLEKLNMIDKVLGDNRYYRWENLITGNKREFRGLHDLFNYIYHSHITPFKATKRKRKKVIFGKQEKTKSETK